MSHEGLLLHQIPWGIQGQSFQLVDTGVPAKDDSDFSWGFAWDKECSGSVSHLYWPFYSGSWAPLQSLEWTPNRWPLTWLTLLLGFPLPLLMKRLYLKNEFPLYLNRQKSYLFHFLQFSSVPFSRSVVSDSLRPHESQHAMPSCPSQTPGVYWNSCLLSRWCHPATSSSVAHFSSCPQSLQASGSFPMSQLLAWGGQSIGVSASASVLPMNTQDWSPLCFPKYNCHISQFVIVEKVDRNSTKRNKRETYSLLHSDIEEGLWIEIHKLNIKFF